MGLFNTTIVKNSTNLVPYEKTVYEHKAPTDKSMELLNEFKEKALKDTMKVFGVKNEDFSFVARFVSDVSTYMKVVTIKFSLNGREIIETIQIDPIAYSTKDEQELIKFCIEKYKEIVSEIMTKSFINYEIREITKL